MMTELPESTPLRSIASQPCPSCGGIYYRGSKTCDTCGVVLSKFEEIRTGPVITGGPRLEKAWLQVLIDYPRESAHEEFLRRCLGENQLAFAAQKYRWLLEANPGDEMAMKMRARCIQVAQLHYVPASRTAAARKAGWDMTSIMLTIGAGLIVSGVMAARAGHSLIGVGFLLVTLTLIQRTFGYRNPSP